MSTVNLGCTENPVCIPEPFYYDHYFLSKVARNCTGVAMERSENLVNAILNTRTKVVHMTARIHSSTLHGLRFCLDSCLTFEHLL